MTGKQPPRDVPFDEAVDTVVESLLAVGRDRGEQLRRSRIGLGGEAQDDKPDISHLIRKDLRGALLDLRAVEVSAPMNADRFSVGSGYLIGNGLVLTARHVVADASDRCVVRTLEDKHWVAATVVWESADSDAALLRITDSVAGGVTPVRLGRLVGDVRVPCTAIGFLSAELQHGEVGGAQRVERVIGEIDHVSREKPGIPEPLMRMYLQGAAPAPREGGRGSWEGMSGAGVVCGELLVAIVAFGRAGFGGDRLSAIPLAELAAAPGFMDTLRAAGARSVIVEAAEAQGVLERPYEFVPTPADRAAASFLLSARYGVVPFRARPELGQLEAWSCSPVAIDAAVLVGGAGTGKSRVGRQLCANLAADRGWVTGFLALDAPAQQVADVLRSSAPLLVVVDYAETRSDEVMALLEQLTHPGMPSAPRRLLLIARQLGDWWTQLKQRTREPHGQLLLGSALELDLAVTDDTLSGRQSAFREATAAFAAFTGRQAAERRLPDLSDRIFETPLFLYMAALSAATRTADTQGRPTESIRADLLARTLEHEEHYWSETAQALQPPLEVDLHVRRRAVTIATLAAPPLGEREAAALLEVVPDLRDDTGLRHRVARWLHGLYPASGGWIGPLEPDLLGETLVAQTLATEPELARDLLGRADAATATRALTVLTRGSRHYGECRAALGDALDHHLRRLARTAVDVAQQQGDPIGTLLADALERHPDSMLAREILESVPQYTVSLREAAVTAATQALRGVPENSDERAKLLVDRSHRLSQLGRREEALSAINEAVTIYRRLADARPDAFLPDHAASLNNQSNVLNDLGRRGDALAVIGEAVSVYRTLAEARPDAFLPDLAASLNNRANRLRELGRGEDALAGIDEAVTIRRMLADARPDAFLPDLAMSLNNQANVLNDLGRREDALAGIDEAVTIRRMLADARPDAFLPDLAMSLNNQANVLNDHGRREDALAAIDEAVTIRRMLADARPDAFLPDLAMSLNNQATFLSDLGRREDALAVIDEAVSVYRVLAEARPDAFLSNLATSLNNQATVLSAAGRSDDALAAIDAALQLVLTRLEQEHYFLPDAGLRLVQNYVKRCEEADREPDAVTMRRMHAVLVSAGIDASSTSGSSG